MSLFSKKDAARTASQAVPEAQEAPAAAAPLLDGELLAVIAASVAAYGADAYEPKLRIQKIRRAAGVRPVWAATGTNEAIDARRM